MEAAARPPNVKLFYVRSEEGKQYVVHVQPLLRICVKYSGRDMGVSRMWGGGG